VTIAGHPAGEGFRRRMQIEGNGFAQAQPRVTGSVDARAEIRLARAAVCEALVVVHPRVMDGGGAGEPAVRTQRPEPVALTLGVDKRCEFVGIRRGALEFVRAMSRGCRHQ